MHQLRDFPVQALQIRVLVGRQSRRQTQLKWRPMRSQARKHGELGAVALRAPRHFVGRGAGDETELLFSRSLMQRNARRRAPSELH
jgi:hypothetical protein